MGRRVPRNHHCVHHRHTDYGPCRKRSVCAGAGLSLIHILPAREYRKVLDHMMALGLDGFCQERSAAKARYVPDFTQFEEPGEEEA